MSAFTFALSPSCFRLLKTFLRYSHHLPLKLSLPFSHLSPTFLPHAQVRGQLETSHAETDAVREQADESRAKLEEATGKLEASLARVALLESQLIELQVTLVGMCLKPRASRRYATNKCATCAHCLARYPATLAHPSHEGKQCFMVDGDAARTVVVGSNWSTSSLTSLHRSPRPCAQHF